MFLAEIVRVCARLLMHVHMHVGLRVHVEHQLRAGVSMAAAEAAVVGVLCVFGCARCQFAVCQQ